MSFIWEIDVDFWSGPEGTDEKDAVLDTISSARSLLTTTTAAALFRFGFACKGFVKRGAPQRLGGLF